jgi:transposase
MNDRSNRDKARVRQVDRNQIKLKILNIEEMIGQTHPARSIWEFVGQQNLESFYEEIKAVAGTAGREPWDPRMMITIWVYGYSRGISSAREIARLCKYDPGFVWISGDMEINHHSLSDFRVNNGEGLKKLFVEVLGAMSSEGLITITRVMQDGTKIEANASGNSYRREGTIRKHLEMAEEQVKRMEELSDQEIGKKAKSRKVASAKERTRRLEKALQELEKVRAAKKTEKEKAESRVSISDPESRVMKESNGGYGPSYNLQIATDADNKIIVGMNLSQSRNDFQELERTVEQVESNTRKRPQEMVVDSGYISAANITSMSKKEIELFGPKTDFESKNKQPGGFHKKLSSNREEVLWERFIYNAETNSYSCPAEKELRPDGKQIDGCKIYYMYRARWSDCQRCSLKSQCCPQNKAKGKTISRKEMLPEVARFSEKMKTEQAEQIYKQRSEVAEFPNLWIKEKMKLRKFRLRGLIKVEIEALWAGLSYNIQQFIRLMGKRVAEA